MLQKLIPIQTILFNLFAIFFVKRVFNRFKGIQSLDIESEGDIFRFGHLMHNDKYVS